MWSICVCCFIRTFAYLFIYCCQIERRRMNSPRLSVPLASQQQSQLFGKTSYSNSNNNKQHFDWHIACSKYYLLICGKYNRANANMPTGS